MADETELPESSPFKPAATPRPTKDKAPKPVEQVKELFTKKKEPVARPKTKPSVRKTDMSGGIALTYGTLGTVISYRSPDLVPVGTTMQIMAPYAGKQLNKAIKRSDIAYRFLSPIFGKADAASEIGSAILPPILVYVMTRNPAAQITLMPMLRMMMRPALIEMAREMAKEKEVLTQLAGEEGSDTDDELNELMAVIFASMVGPEAQAQEPSGPAASGPTDQPGFLRVETVG